MKFVPIGHDETVPALGQGTWFMGDVADGRADEIAALRRGVELGMKVIDTAEMYGSGASEILVGEAIAPIRDDVFLVSKVLPHNASQTGTIKACEQSLKRLKTDRIDLYLLHWRGPTDLEETIAAFEELKQAGKIRHWGVSNFDAEDMEELLDTPGGEEVVTNQVLYNLTRRGIEWDQLPQSEGDGLSIMAYSPIEQARLLAIAPLQNLAEDLDITPAQLALSWVLRNPTVIAIPKAGTLKHVEENARAAEIVLTQDVLNELDMIFPAPLEATSLEML
ncbi:aldo/keto reductase [Cohaesibacter celericrescens]|uniref:Oxidoreductase n=1 Tax=Cohaesibacter celericrescens TaxID=2067669 RepID=A0A2N5XSD1_9HYPH|nr:aldo/keto reductase [Cohaesibacter celericrescens]PLW77404.1 oxidoreductase [Cohaesibacter celericrescens]